MVQINLEVRRREPVTAGEQTGEGNDAGTAAAVVTTGTEGR
jgi:hypothetical protein